MTWSSGPWHPEVGDPELHNFPQHVFPNIHHLWFWHLEWDAASNQQRSIPSSRHQSRGSRADATGRHVYQGRRETSCQELSLIISALRELSCPIHLPRTKHLAKHDGTADRSTDGRWWQPASSCLPALNHRHVCEKSFQNEAFRKWITRKTDFFNVTFFFRNTSSFDTYYICLLKYVLRVKSFRISILQNVKHLAFNDIFTVINCLF
jgi:hypothetical protein